MEKWVIILRVLIKQFALVLPEISEFCCVAENWSDGFYSVLLCDTCGHKIEDNWEAYFFDINQPSSKRFSCFHGKSPEYVKVKKLDCGWNIHVCFLCETPIYTPLGSDRLIAILKQFKRGQISKEDLSILLSLLDFRFRSRNSIYWGEMNQKDIDNIVRAFKTINPNIPIEFL